MSRENEIMSFLVTTFRTLGLIVLFIAPFSSQIDKRLRQIGVSAVIEFKGVEDYEKIKQSCLEVGFLAIDWRKLFAKTKIDYA